MAVPSLYPNMRAETSQAQEIVLVKILAWLIELVTGGVPGATGAVQVVNASAPSNSRVIKASPGTLLTLQAYNSSGSTVYLQVFDAVAMPLDGTIPTLAPVTLPSDSIASIDFGQRGRPFSTGIVAAFSSSPTFLTNVGGAMFDATYL